MATMVTHRYITNTIRSQSLPSVAKHHARLPGSAWLDRPGHDAHLVPAGGFRLAQRSIGRADEFGQCPPGPVENSDADGYRQPEHEASVAAVLDRDRFPGDQVNWVGYPGAWLPFATWQFSGATLTLHADSSGETLAPGGTEVVPIFGRGDTTAPSGCTFNGSGCQP